MKLEFSLLEKQAKKLRLAIEERSELDVMPSNAPLIVAEIKGIVRKLKEQSRIEEEKLKKQELAPVWSTYGAHTNGLLHGARWLDEGVQQIDKTIDLSIKERRLEHLLESTIGFLNQINRARSECQKILANPKGRGKSFSWLSKPRMNGSYERFNISIQPKFPNGKS